MKKKILSIITALCCFTAIQVSSVSAMVGYETINDNGEILKEVNGYTYVQVESAEAVEGQFPDGRRGFNRCEYLYLRTDGRELLAYERQPDYITFKVKNVNGDYVEIEQLNELIKDIDPQVEIHPTYLKVDDGSRVLFEGSINNIKDIFTGKKIVSAISKQFDNLDVRYLKPYYIYNRQLRALPTYKGEYREAIEKYISDNDINMTVQNVDYSDEISLYKRPEGMSEEFWEQFTEREFAQFNEIELISETEMSAIEVLDFENELYNATGIRPIWTELESAMGDSEEYNGKDVLNGDANCDKGVGLADALAILQYTANAVKYPLTTQGLFNADIVGSGDGITPLDALEIQKWDAHYVDPGVPQPVLE